MTNSRIQKRVGLIALILVVLGLVLSVVGAIQQDVLGKAWLQVVNLSLLSVAALSVIAVIWGQYAKQQTVGPIAFLTLAIITIIVLGKAWAFLAQIIRRS